MKKDYTRKMVQRGRVGVLVGLSTFIATAAFADTAEKAGSGGMSLFMVIFLAVVGAIVLLQLVPAMVIFGSIITAVFKRSKKAVETKAVDGQI